MFKALSILTMLACSVASGDILNARGGGQFGFAWCLDSAVDWDPSCQSGLIMAMDNIGAAEFVTGGNGNFQVFNLDPLSGGRFQVSLPGQPKSTITDQFGNLIYAFSGGAISYSGGAFISGYGSTRDDQPPGYHCIDLPIGGCGLSPGVSMAFTGIFIGDVFVTFAPGRMVEARGPVNISVDPSLAAYAGFSRTGGFIGSYSGDTSAFFIGGTAVPEPATIFLLVTLIIALSLKFRPPVKSE